MKKFVIKTLGCKVNRHESDYLAIRLKQSGFSELRNEDAEISPPTVCIVNTCAVTQKAAMQSRQAVRRMVRLFPNAEIIATGCYAQVEPDALRAISGVDRIVGHADKLSIFAPASGETGSADRPICKVFPGAVIGNRTRPVLKIQDGCEAFCAYCIVPYSRGPSRSMPVEPVLKQIEWLEEAGCREVVLSGIHIGWYGRDLSPPTNLFSLLKRIEKETSIPRIRLSSIEPLELGEELLRLASDSERICPHFHIPLQSGDDRILRKMGRPYTRKQFESLVYRIHRHMPAAAVGLDVMVGFPGETPEAFNHTKELIQSLPVAYLHVFPFSARKGTVAETLPGPVPPPVKKERGSRLRQIGAAKRRHFYRSFIGKAMQVLIEGNPENACKKGLTPNYIPVLLETTAKENTIAHCRIERVDKNNRVYGTVEKPMTML